MRALGTCRAERAQAQNSLTSTCTQLQHRGYILKSTRNILAGTNLSSFRVRAGGQRLGQLTRLLADTTVPLVLPYVAGRHR